MPKDETTRIIQGQPKPTETNVTKRNREEMRDRKEKVNNIQNENTNMKRRERKETEKKRCMKQSHWKGCETTREDMKKNQRPGDRPRKLNSGRFEFALHASARASVRACARKKERATHRRPRAPDTQAPKVPHWRTTDRRANRLDAWLHSVQMQTKRTAMNPRRHIPDDPQPQRLK